MIFWNTYSRNLFLAASEIVWNLTITVLIWIYSCLTVLTSITSTKKMIKVCTEGRIYSKYFCFLLFEIFILIQDINLVRVLYIYWGRLKCSSLKIKCYYDPVFYFFMFYSTAPKMKFSIKDSFSKRDQKRSFLRIWSQLLKKSLMENYIFCAVPATIFTLFMSFAANNKNWAKLKAAL